MLRRAVRRCRPGLVLCSTPEREQNRSPRHTRPLGPPRDLIASAFDEQTSPSSGSGRGHAQTIAALWRCAHDASVEPGFCVQWRALSRPRLRAMPAAGRERCAPFSSSLMAGFWRAVRRRTPGMMKILPCSRSMPRVGSKTGALMAAFCFSIFVGAKRPSARHRQRCSKPLLALGRRRCRWRRDGHGWCRQRHRCWSHPGPAFSTSGLQLRPTRWRARCAFGAAELRTVRGPRATAARR